MQNNVNHSKHCGTTPTDNTTPLELACEVVDAHSKWFEVIPMITSTTDKTISELQKLFAAHGLPEQLVTDNGTQFTSEEFQGYLKTSL